MELVIAVALVGIIGVPLGLLLSEHLRAAYATRESSIAVQLARAELERLDSLNDFFAPDLTVGTTVLPAYQGTSYDLAREVTCLAGNCTKTEEKSEGMKRIRVTVTPSGSSTTLVRLTTDRTKHVYFGI